MHDHGFIRITVLSCQKGVCCSMPIHEISECRPRVMLGPSHLNLLPSIWTLNFSFSIFTDPGSGRSLSPAQAAGPQLMKTGVRQHLLRSGPRTSLSCAPVRSGRFVGPRPAPHRLGCKLSGRAASPLGRPSPPPRLPGGGWSLKGDWAASLPGETRCLRSQRWGGGGCSPAPARPPQTRMALRGQALCTHPPLQPWDQPAAGLEEGSACASRVDGLGWGQQGRCEPVSRSGVQWGLLDALLPLP